MFALEGDNKAFEEDFKKIETINIDLDTLLIWQEVASQEKWLSTE